MHIKVGLVQIGDSFGEGQYYFPYSIGLLQGYAEKYLREPKAYEFMTPIYKRIPIHCAVDYLSKADIVFFSTYLWNFQISIDIAKNLKRNNTETIIVFGGAQIPESTERLNVFLKIYPFVDIACYGEGEIPFLTILDNYFDCKWADVPSIGYMERHDRFVRNSPIDRISDLDKIPSPYLSGVFDELVEENPQVSWSVIWETNRGCPFACTFCAWGCKDNKKIYHFDLDRLCREIDWFGRKKIEFIFCCDANFGMFERDMIIAQKMADSKNRVGYPCAFSVQNTKNSTENIFRLQKILNDAGLQKGVNIAFQSMNPATLKSIKRINIKNAEYRKLQRMFIKEGIPTFTDIILGLPEETYETLTWGISSLIESGQHNKIQFINLALLENTTMSKSEYQNKYSLVLQVSKIVQHHTSIDTHDEVCEKQVLVVGTNTMPREKWIDSRVFCWMVSLLYFNKLLQIPFVFLNKIYSIPYKKLIEIFFVPLAESSDKGDGIPCKANSGFKLPLYNIPVTGQSSMIRFTDEEYPCISEIHSFLRQKAISIQNGDSEYVPSKEWLNIWWPPEEYIFIRLFKENKLSLFYKEAGDILKRFLIQNNLEVSTEVLDETLMLNRRLLKTPFVNTDLNVSLDYNVYEVYRKMLIGINIPIENERYHYLIDRSSQIWITWDCWFRDVVWYGGKKGAFFYNCVRK